MLEVEHLSVSYGAHRALEDVSLHVAAGEICVILGANGAGKSSLLKAIAGMVPSAADTRIAIGGRNIAGAKPHKVVEAGLALVPEGRGIFGDLTVAENLQLGAYGPQAHAGKKARHAAILDLFPRLAERSGQIVCTMSGGEQQMVAIGRALMSAPEILMLDEPSLGLSPLLTKDLFKSLKAVRETGVGILLVEQNAKQSLAIADRGYLIENGRITGEGTGVGLASDPAVQAAYLGGAVAPASAVPADAEGAYMVPTATGGSCVGRERRQRTRLSAGDTGGLNGHRHGKAGVMAKREDAIIRSSQAQELSLQAAEMAKRATRIQREHVELQRVNHHLSSAKAAAKPERMATAGPSAEAGDGTATLESKKLKGRGRKLAKKALKLARKAERLAEKALKASR